MVNLHPFRTQISNYKYTSFFTYAKIFLYKHKNKPVQHPGNTPLCHPQKTEKKLKQNP